MAKPSGKKKIAPSFERAIEEAEHVSLIRGLGALKRGEGKGRIVADSGALIGSVDIDESCRAAYPNDNRWDYVIGLRSGKGDAAVFVEVHSAETSAVSTMEHKLEWLLRFLSRGRQRSLNDLPREIHWVASGRVNIPQHLPQYKKLVTTLRLRGLQGPVTQLALG